MVQGLVGQYGPSGNILIWKITIHLKSARSRSQKGAKIHRRHVKISVFTA